MHCFSIQYYLSILKWYNRVIMKVTAVIAQSVNGRMTRGEDANVYTWTSIEDKKHLKDVIGKAKLIVMGSKTYLEAKRNIKLNPYILRIVLTSQPESFADDEVKGQLEFYNDSPQEICKKYEKKYDELLLLGGNTIYSLFLKEGLIDECVITIEPYLFGKGISFIHEDINAQLELISCRKLNEKGTLLVTYKVKK